MMQILQDAFDKRATKINKIEKIKEIKDPIEAYNKLEQYAKEGYDSITPEDKGFFLKCFGIFDKASTPNQFMMRIRIPGGQLTYPQAIALGQIAREFGEDYIDLTTRAQIELRFIKIENIPTLLKKLGDVGISSYQTGVDNFRGLVGDPLDNQAFDNILPSQQILLKLQSLFLFNKDWIAKLPRKFNTSITGSMINRCNAYGHDCCFVLAQKNGVYGYNMYLGGKVGKVAQNADIFLRNEEEVLSAYEAISTLFKKYGFRDNRNRNRLFFLIESVGVENLAKSIREYCQKDFPSSGLSLTNIDSSDSDQGKMQLKDGTFGVHVSCLAGVFSGSALIKAAQLSNKHGNGDIRLNIEQDLYLMNIRENEINSLLKDEFFNKYKNISSAYANHLIACAGEKHCQYGVIPNKPDAIEMVEYLSKKVPLSADSKIRMYWSGCVKGCGLHSLGDIGFEGCKAKVDGVNEYGVHIFLGGKTSGNSKEGFTVLRAIPLRFAKYYVESLALEYKKHKLKDESFEGFSQRVLDNYSRGAIGFMMLLQAYIRKNNLNIDIGFKKDIKTGKNENFEIFDIGRKLYKSFVNEEPYLQYETFSPNATSKFKKIKDTSLNQNFVNLIHEMLDKTNQAQVFSQIQHYVEYKA